MLSLMQLERELRKVLVQFGQDLSLRQTLMKIHLNVVCHSET